MNHKLNPEWDKLRQLKTKTKSSAERTAAGFLSMGKEALRLRKNLPYTHGGDRKKSSPHDADLIDQPTTLEGWCQSQLGVSPDTFARWIAGYEAALDTAKNRKSKNPEMFRLLNTPAAELAGDELELLSVHIGRLIRNDEADERHLTQRQIFEELGIVKPSKKAPGGDTSKHAKRPPRHGSLGELALEIFTQIDASSDALEESIVRSIKSDEFKEMLAKLDLEIASDTDPEAWMASLMGTKRSLESAKVKIERAKAKLEGVITDTITKILEDVDAAIEERMHGEKPKGPRNKSKLARMS